MSGNNIKIPENIEKIERSQFVTFLDTTPTTEPTWSLLGVGITDYSIEHLGL